MQLSVKDLKKLSRAGIEPARVFARRDFDPDDNRPVLHYQTRDREFYSPHFPTWMFEGGDELHVIEKAIDRYGLEEAPVTGRWWDYADFLFDPRQSEDIVKLADAEYRQMTNGTIVPFFYLGGLDFVAATPVTYAHRRWGDDIVFTLQGKFFRIIHDGRVVGVVRLQDGSYLTEPVGD